MRTYIMIVAAVLVLSSFISRQNRVALVLNEEEKTAQKDRNLMWLISLILIFFAGVRFRVGADYLSYASYYGGYFMDELELFGEPGIRIIARLAHWIYDDYATMFIIMSIITVGLCLYRIAKSSPFWMVSVLMYIFLGCWHSSFNAVRQCAAAAILFAGHPYLKKKQFMPWLLVVCVASLFHISAIVFIALYWLPTKKLTLKKVIFFLCVGIVMAFVYDIIWDFVGFLKDTEDMGTTVYETNHINAFRIIVAWIPIVFYMLVVKKHVELGERSAMNFYANMSLVGAAIVLAARYSAYLARMVVYTDLYNTLFWAYLIKDLFTHQKTMKDKRIWLFIILGCYFLYYLYEANGVYLVNYQTIFTR